MSLRAAVISVACLVGSGPAAQASNSTSPALAACGQGGNERGQLAVRMVLDEAADKVDVVWWELLHPRWGDADRTVRAERIGAATYHIDGREEGGRALYDWDYALNGTLVEGVNPFDTGGAVSPIRLEITQQYWAGDKSGLFMRTGEAAFTLDGAPVNTASPVTPQEFLDQWGTSLSELTDAAQA